MAKKTGGWPSIFRPKVKGDSNFRVQGFLTRKGMAAFEKQRKLLGERIGRPAARISDADVIEALARGAYGQAAIEAARARHKE